MPIFPRAQAGLAGFLRWYFSCLPVTLSQCPSGYCHAGDTVPAVCAWCGAISPLSDSHPCFSWVQVYFSQRISRYTRYQSMLGGWAKVQVPAGPWAVVEVSVPIPYSAMAYWDPKAADMVLEAGVYTFSVCSSSNTNTCSDGNDVKVPSTVVGL